MWKILFLKFPWIRKGYIRKIRVNLLSLRVLQESIHVMWSVPSVADTGLGHTLGLTCIYWVGKNTKYTGIHRCSTLQLNNIEGMLGTEYICIYRCWVWPVMVHDVGAHPGRGAPLVVVALLGLGPQQPRQPRVRLAALHRILTHSHITTHHDLQTLTNHFLIFSTLVTRTFCF